MMRDQSSNGNHSENDDTTTNASSGSSDGSSSLLGTHGSRYNLKKPSPCKIDETISPTDESWSPTSMKLKLLQRKMSKPEGLTLDFHLESHVPRKEFPLSESCPLILGSASKNRKEILEMIKWPFTTMIPDIDEKAIRCTNVFELPQLIAAAKAAALLPRVREEYGPDKQCVLVTSDEIVIFQNEVREKPMNEDEAIRFLSSYSNNYLTTVTAVVAVHYPSERQVCDVDITQVYWGEISEEVVQRVIARGDIFSSAGGFRIEDPDLNPLIRDVEGHLDSVMGMPVELTYRLINTVKDPVSFELNNLTHQIFHYKNIEPDFDETWRERRPSDSTYYIRRRAVKSWGRSRSGTTESRSRSGSRNRAFTGKSDMGSGIALDVTNTAILVPLSVPGSPTDRTLSPVSMQLSKRKSPIVKPGGSSKQYSKKREYHLQTEIVKRPCPFPHTAGTLILASDDKLKQLVLDILEWNYLIMKPIESPATTTTTANANTAGAKETSPIRVAENIAKSESQSIMSQLQEQHYGPQAIVISTHQVIMIEGVMRQLPPKDMDEAIAFLKSYSNQKVMTVTVVVVTHYPSGRQACDTDIAIAHFKDISPDAIESIAAREENLHRIGALNIEDVDLNPLIHHIDGSMDSLASLPTDMLSRLILNVSDEYFSNTSLSHVRSGSGSGLSLLQQQQQLQRQRDSSMSLSMDDHTTTATSTPTKASSNQQRPPLQPSSLSQLQQQQQSQQQQQPQVLKRITLRCPGKKLSVRVSPNIKAEVIRNLSNNDTIEVTLNVVSGYYELANQGGYVSKSAAGVEWVDANTPATTTATATKT